MARLPRNTIEYFPHPVAHGKKMFYLRSKYKNDGYAVWFILLEQLGRSDNHYLDLSSEIQTMFLASECMVEQNILIEIINILVQFGDFDKQLWDEKRVLWNDKFVQNIQDAYKHRSNKPLTKEALTRVLSGLPRGNDEVNGQNLEAHPQSKVNKSKVNKSKVKDEVTLPFLSEDFKNAWEKLLTLPKWQKKPTTAIQASLDTLAQYPEVEAIEMMRKATAGNWQGVFPLDDKDKLKLYGTKNFGNNERRTREYGKPL